MANAAKAVPEFDIIRPDDVLEQIAPDTETTPNAPKRRGRPPGSKNRNPTTPRRGRGPSLETRVGAALAKYNMMALVILQIAPGMNSEDALDADEIIALAHGLVAEANAHARFRTMLEAAIAVGNADSLYATVLIIAARRAARHHILPAELDTIGSAALGNAEAMRTLFTPKPVPSPESEDVPEFVAVS